MDKKTIKVAIAGNPNTGKTTIFNNLTGENQYVGNWPGVTVEKKQGEFEHKGHKIILIDLPGIYGFSSYSIDEKVARDFLLEKEADIILNVVDSTNLERNLYLNMEFQELGIPIIICLNMIDELENKNLSVDAEKLSKYLGAGIVKTNARKKVGMDLLKDKIIECAENGYQTGKMQFNYPDYINNEIIKITNLLEKSTDKNFKYPLRWLAIELLEGESDVFDKLKEEKWFNQIKEQVDKSRKAIETNAGEKIMDHIVAVKYSYLKGLVKEVVTQKHTENVKAKRYENTMELSDKIDKFVLHPFLGVPVFLFVMFLIFFLTFALGNPLVEILDNFFNFMGEQIAVWLNSMSVNSLFISFITEGIIDGVGGVVIFLPNILILFTLIAILEDSGYMARASVVMDKFMHLIGLHGKSFIPMIIGFGCNVPAVMATRTLENQKDRILTMMIIPFMSCSARLPIYILFTSLFFRENQALVVWLLYMFGILTGVLTAKIAKKVLFKKEEMPLIIEIPPYRLPQVSSLIRHAWFRGKMFLQKAGTVILLGVTLSWFLANVPFGVKYASENSVLGIIGRFISPVFAPAGFGFWQAAVTLVTGIFAKEIVVGTISALFSGQGAEISVILSGYFTPLSAFSFMIFSLLYTPCLPTLAVMKQEGGLKYVILIAIYNFLIALIFATIIFQAGRLLGFK
jgi:ferrous iron transport protein B